MHLCHERLFYAVLLYDNPTSPLVVFRRVALTLFAVGCIVATLCFVGGCGAATECICFLVSVSRSTAFSINENENDNEDKTITKLKR